MLRKILLLCPAIAFALPFIAATPSLAKPLSIPAQPAEWGDQWNQFDEDLLLAVCVQTQIFVQTGQSDRAYDCDTLTGPTCLANCAGDDADTCRSQCNGDGAMFCSPSLKSRWGGNQGWGPGWGPWGGFGPNWDDDDQDFDQDEALFVDTQTCLELNLAEA